MANQRFLALSLTVSYLKLAGILHFIRSENSLAVYVAPCFLPALARAIISCILEIESNWSLVSCPIGLLEIL